VGVGVGVGVGFRTVKPAWLETEPDVVEPAATPVPVPLSEEVCPLGALVGMANCARNWVVWFACSVPTVHVAVPSPLAQVLKLGVPKLVGTPETCTATLLALPPVGQMLITNCSAWPGCTELDVACTLMQSSVRLAFPDDVGLGEGLGDGPGPVVGGGGNGWHTLVGAVAPLACTPAKAAAAVPTHSTDTPAKAANTVDPARPLRREAPGWELSCGVNSRFSIIG
jgi:hypothetical protein